MENKYKILRYRHYFKDAGLGKIYNEKLNLLLDLFATELAPEKFAFIVASQITNRGCLNT